MPYVLCNRASKRIISAIRWAQHSGVPAQDVEIKWPTMPNAAEMRWDGSDGLRPVTPSELSDVKDEEEQETEDVAIADQPPLTAALIEMLFDQEDRLATLEGRPSTNRAAFDAHLRNLVRTAVRGT